MLFKMLSMRSRIEEKISRASLNLDRFSIVALIVHNVWIVWFFFFAFNTPNLHLINKLGFRVRVAAHGAETHRKKHKSPKLLKIQ
ncbi:hypothetical protein C9980_11035 [Vibrio mediterranei]|uniref:DUF3265 domain-containing protein n=1 Tax=Vibrio mediterranei TaxID=689 RepID=A0ABX5DEG8_9VIBR|nr:hypothetical protein COR52_06375 [Vibrio mediterranei]PRQ68094.1 hypothetical protein COR51_06450 [Vibrio mediterranei]PTC04828.1 hypothetical protein C9980_11035 [Vibrio mediterranei]